MARVGVRVDVMGEVVVGVVDAVIIGIGVSVGGIGEDVIVGIYTDGVGVITGVDVLKTSAVSGSLKVVTRATIIVARH